MCVILLSSTLAKSKILHYFSGASIFTLLGALLLVFFIMNRISPNSKITWGFLAIASYSASMFWFFVSGLKVVVMNYLEYVFIYVLLTAAAGMFFVSTLRSDAGKKTLKDAVRLFFRIIGLIFVYNSAAS
jgi:hypothetical protein